MYLGINNTYLYIFLSMLKFCSDFPLACYMLIGFFTQLSVFYTIYDDNVFVFIFAPKHIKKCVCVYDICNGVL